MAGESVRLAPAKRALLEAGVLESLQVYNPTVVSTIWVGLDTEASDIDIVCCYQRATDFVDAAYHAFSRCQDYSLSQNSKRILVRFLQEKMVNHERHDDHEWRRDLNHHYPIRFHHCPFR